MDNAPPQVAGRRRPPEEEVMSGACCLLSFVTLRCLSPQYLIFCGLTPRTLQSSLMLDFFSLISPPPPPLFLFFLSFPLFGSDSRVCLTFLLDALIAVMLNEDGTAGYKNTLSRLGVVATKAAAAGAKQNRQQQSFFYGAAERVLAIRCDPCFSWPRLAVSCQKLILLRNFASETGT